MGVWLPTATKRQTREKLVRKERFFIQMLNVRENMLPVSKLISSAKPRHNPAILSKTKTKGSAQRSCPILKYRPLEPKAAASDYPSSLACSQLLSGFRLLPGGGLCVELVLPLAMQFLGPQVLMAPGPETMVNTLANAPPGQRERQRLPPGGHGSCDC